MRLTDSTEVTLQIGKHLPLHLAFYFYEGTPYKPDGVWVGYDKDVDPNTCMPIYAGNPYQTFDEVLARTIAAFLQVSLDNTLPV